MTDGIDPMTPAARAAARSNARLSRDRVVRAAIAQADAGGLVGVEHADARRWARVAPMALYRHVANKDDLVDAMIDAVFGEVELPKTHTDWTTAMRQRAFSLRAMHWRAIAGLSA